MDAKITINREKCFWGHGGMEVFQSNSLPNLSKSE